MMKIILALFFLTFSANSYSDQNSPKLEDLFDDLYNAQDISQQNKIVSNIWAEWMKIDNPESQKIMDMVPYFFQTRNYDDAIEALSYVIEKEQSSVSICFCIRTPYTSNQLKCILIFMKKFIVLFEYFIFYLFRFV